MRDYLTAKHTHNVPDVPPSAKVKVLRTAVTVNFYL